jgi:TonB-linked SusC/RagA family outer membrane protein
MQLMKKRLLNPNIFWTIMKISFQQIFLSTLFCVLAYAHKTAGQDVLNKTISIELEGVEIKKVLTLIEKQADVRFMYSSSTINTSQKINIKASNKRLELVLKEILKPLYISYLITENQILLKKDKVESGFTPSVPNTPQIPDNTPLVGQTVNGVVTGENGEPLPGVTILIKGTQRGANTDPNGKFKIEVPDDAILIFSFVGYLSQEISVAKRTLINVAMMPDNKTLTEVVVVGYGVQKKASVVGAIVTASNKELQRTGGVTNLAQALTGNLPGVSVIQTTGQPGKADPKIFIRGQSTWNGGEPYILVDGVERRMNDLDMSEVDNISVLKDASATAVYGVKGANGVILITTKRGINGKPILTLTANTTFKTPSRLVPKLDAYDIFRIKNDAIERELATTGSDWGNYTPPAIIQRYRNPGNFQNLKYPEAFPNVDWQKETIKEVAINQRLNLNVAGGNDFVKYFSSLAYLHEGDSFKVLDTKGYGPGYGYDKFNFRTNLDLNLTRSTIFRINLAGIYGTILSTALGTSQENILNGQYTLPPNAFLPVYADGRWGKSLNSETRLNNSAAFLSQYGLDKVRQTDLTSDFGITQKLDFITEGLSFNGRLSFDNHFESIGGISDPANNYATKYINPAIEDIAPEVNPNNYITLGPTSGVNQFSWVEKPWSIRDESAEAQLSTLRRRLFYQAQFSYARTFGKHDVTGTGVFNREQVATGSEFQRYREDWVLRGTYNFDNKYFAEFNGAYNGSEKFGPKYRFAFFPSMAVGWAISQEKFLNNVSWLDNLKVRYSYGLIGDDSGIAARFLYNTQYALGTVNTGGINSALLGQYISTPGNTVTGVSPYTIFREALLGNPDIHWEQAIKSNLGLDFSIYKNLLSGTFEYFTEDRTDILLDGASRKVNLPTYFGTTLPTANVGHVTKKGYEVELRIKKDFGRVRVWANANLTNAVDKIIDKEEPLFKNPQLLAKNFQIDQTKSTISNGYLQNWNDIYGSTPNNANDGQKLPGDYRMLDFDGDGVIDGIRDQAPYGYSTRPQNTYSFSLGTDYKGFSLMVQFYGVNNVTRNVPLENFPNSIDISYSPFLNHWSKENPNAEAYLPRWKVGTGVVANYFQYDASYLRLKTAEIAYTFSGARLKRTGLSSLRLFVNGNNLMFWSKLPDDREQSTAIGGDRFGAYPTSRLINTGIDIKF